MQLGRGDRDSVTLRTAEPFAGTGRSDDARQEPPRPSRTTNDHRPLTMDDLVSVLRRVMGRPKFNGSIVIRIKGGQPSAVDVTQTATQIDQL